MHVLTAQVVDSTLSVYPNLDLLGPFTTEDVDVWAIRVRKNIYLPAPDLIPVEAWSRLCGTIIEAGSTVYFHSIIDWICVSLTSKSGEYQPSPLSMSLPTAPL